MSPVPILDEPLLSDTLRRLVEYSGWSGQQCAKKLRVNTRDFRRWVIGEKEPPWMACELLARFIKEKDWGKS